MTASALLLLPLVSALAQDGHNIYKDMQRGRVELESLVVDDDRPVDLDHASHTWPSAGARVHVVGSAKRTLGRLKVHEHKANPEDEALEDSDEPTTQISYEGNEEELGRRTLIPRTQSLIRGMELIGKPKRGPSSRSSSGLSFARDPEWLLERGSIQLPAWYKSYLAVVLPPREQCQLISPQKTLICNWLKRIIIQNKS